MSECKPACTSPLKNRKHLQSIHGLHVISAYLEASKGSQLICVLAFVALLQQRAAASAIMTSSLYLDVFEHDDVVTCVFTPALHAVQVLTQL